MHPKIKTPLIKPNNQIRNTIRLYFGIVEFCAFFLLEPLLILF